MTDLRPGLPRLILTTHVVSSVGWLGAVAAFLALALAGLNAGVGLQARAPYVAMEVLTWWVIVPLCVASLVTGLVQSLCTRWGLFRHYWVVAKLVLTLLATVVLLLHTQPIGHLAEMAADAELTGPHVGRLQVQLVADAGAALAVLVVTTVLAVYKPRGLTRHGARRQHRERITAGH